ncbi:uncharacterized protein LOC103834333 [Brassica rapa]|uniref:uncharacterized protein LOC103834333 n=1 Tax=Brassica campestris TaxID=3711 RepID=UPI0004F1930D|nr:uncharacterized protein LOC103834333 [Brassica rapa]
MVAIKNELQKFKEEVIRSVMEIHNKENGTTVRRGGNVSNSNNQQPDGDDDLPHRDANAAERGADARTLSTANTASPVGVQPNSGGVDKGNNIPRPISRAVSEGSNHDIPTRSINSHAINVPVTVVDSSSLRLREEQNPPPSATRDEQITETGAEHGEEDSNEDPIQPPASLKCKRQKTVPSEHVIETNPGTELLSVYPPPASPLTSYSDIAVVMSKYTKLCQKICNPFVINVSGLSVTSKDLTAIAELSRSLPARVIDILVRFVRTTYKREVNSRSDRNPLFLDTRYVALMLKHYEKFERSKSPDSYNFPKDLLQYLASDDSTTAPFTHYYFSYDLGNKQWIGVCFDCAAWKFTVLDSNITVLSDSEMAIKLQPFTQMIPALLKRNGWQPTNASEFWVVFDRPTGIHQNQIHSHSGLTAILLMQSHGMFGIAGCKSITPTHLTGEAKRIVVMVYELHQKL